MYRQIVYEVRESPEQASTQPMVPYNQLGSGRPDAFVGPTVNHWLKCASATSMRNNRPSMSCTDLQAVNQDIALFGRNPALIQSYLHCGPMLPGHLKISLDKRLALIDEPAHRLTTCYQNAPRRSSSNFVDLTVSWPRAISRSLSLDSCTLPMLGSLRPDGSRYARQLIASSYR